jgi:hypothetical protein
MTISRLFRFGRAVSHAGSSSCRPADDDSRVPSVEGRSDRRSRSRLGTRDAARWVLALASLDGRPNGGVLWARAQSRARTSGLSRAVVGLRTADPDCLRDRAHRREPDRLRQRVDCHRSRPKPSKWASATQTGWNYLNAVALALCEGTIAGIGNVWADKDAKADFAPSFSRAICGR